VQVNENACLGLANVLFKPDQNGHRGERHYPKMVQIKCFLSCCFLWDNTTRPVRFCSKLYLSL